MNRDYTGTIIYTSGPEEATAVDGIQRVYAALVQKRREQLQAALKEDLPTLESELEAITAQEMPSQNPQSFPPSD